MLLLLSLSTQTPTGTKFSLTKQAIQHFGEQFLINAPEIINNNPIGEITYTADLGITKVKAIFNNIKLLEVEFDKLEIQLENQFFQLKNTKLRGSLEYDLAQLSFPYLRLTGNADISASVNIQIQAKIFATESRKLAFETVSTNFEILYLTANFHNQFINGIFTKMQPLMVKIVQNQIFPLIFDVVSRDLSLFFDKIQDISTIDGDCQFDYSVNSVVIDDRSMSVHHPGFCNSGIQTVSFADNYTNDGVNLIVARTVFESVIGVDFSVQIRNGIVLSGEFNGKFFKTLCKAEMEAKNDFYTKLVLRCDKEHELVDKYNRNAVLVYGVLLGDKNAPIQVIYQPDYIVLTQIPK